MRMSMSPMQYMALNCAACGQPLEKHPHAAGDNEVISVGVGCGAIDPVSVKTGHCLKCGQLILSTSPVVVTCVCGHGPDSHRKVRRVSPCKVADCVCMRYRPVGE